MHHVESSENVRLSFVRFLKNPKNIPKARRSLKRYLQSKKDPGTPVILQGQIL